MFSVVGFLAHMLLFFEICLSSQAAMVAWFDGWVFSTTIGTLVFKKFYKCNFCQIDYNILPFSILRFPDKLMALLGLRLYQCPHCFSCARLPWLPLRKKNAKNSADSEVELDRDSTGDCGPVVMLPAKPEVSELVPEAV